MDLVRGLWVIAQEPYHRGVPPAKLFGKFSRRARDKQLVFEHGYWNCFRFPTDLGFLDCSSSGLDLE